MSRPPRRIPVDASRLAPVNTWQDPPDEWIDRTFRCRDCGAAEVFTAGQQRDFYEGQQQPLYRQRVRCARCADRREALRGLGHALSEATAAAKRSSAVPVALRAISAMVRYHRATGRIGHRRLRTLLDRLPESMPDPLVVRQARAIVAGGPNSTDP